MKKEAIFKKGFKEMIEKMPVEDITVIALCEHVKSNRQTFYYHFRDMYDLINSIMLKEEIVTSSSVVEFDTVFNDIYKYINSNFFFLKSIKTSFAGNLVDDFFYSYINERLTAKFKMNPVKGLVKEDRISIQRVLSNSLALEFSFYISTTKKEGLHHFKERLRTIWNYFLGEHLKGLTK